MKRRSAIAPAEREVAELATSIVEVSMHARGAERSPGDREILNLAGQHAVWGLERSKERDLCRLGRVGTVQIAVRVDLRATELPRAREVATSAIPSY